MFLTQLKSAIEEEHKAYYFYKSMLALTNNPTWVTFISETMEDEKSHYEMFQQLHYMMTGQYVPTPVEKPVCKNLKECALRSVEDELQTAKKYKMMFLTVPIEAGKNPLFIAMHDEMEHAIRFSTIYNAL